MMKAIKNFMNKPITWGDSFKWSGTFLGAVCSSHRSMRYVLTLPIRTYEYIYDTISGELTSQRGSRIRFQNLKQNGHI